MIIAEQLEKEVAQSFNIKKEPSENKGYWIKRIIYSLIARNAYASLWDIQEVDPSITHFKNRAKESFQALKAIYPEYLNILNEDDIKALSEYTYQLYLESGQLYHSPNRIKYSKTLVSQFNEISLVRSPQPYDVVYMSGAGFYIGWRDESDASLYDLFDISSKKLSEFYNFLTDMKLEENNLFEGRIQYLQITGTISKGYWKYDSDIDGRLSLLKIGYPGSELYYLYKYKDNKLMTCQLPEWRVKNKGYLDIACAILHHNQTLLPILYEVDGELVHIKLQYLLPPKLQLFFELYSWPYSFVGKSRFKRMMNIRVFNIFKSLLEELEFEFKEGK